MIITKSNNYELSVNTLKNYLVIALLGVWDKSAQLDYYIEDIKYAIERVSSGFNLLIDLTQYRGSTSDRTNLHLEAQKEAIKAGINKTAVLMQDNPMLKITVDFLFQMSGIKPTYFNSYSSAENWLLL
jgi:hypothetical protein